MWRDVFLYNREAVLEMPARFNEDLMQLQRAIRYGDGEALFEHTRTRAIRKSIIDIGQETAACRISSPGRRGRRSSIERRNDPTGNLPSWSTPSFSSSW